MKGPAATVEAVRRLVKSARASETPKDENSKAGNASLAGDDSAEVRADTAAEVADTAEKLDEA